MFAHQAPHTPNRDYSTCEAGLASSTLDFPSLTAPDLCILSTKTIHSLLLKSSYQVFFGRPLSLVTKKCQGQKSAAVGSQLLLNCSQIFNVKGKKLKSPTCSGTG